MNRVPFARCPDLRRTDSVQPIAVFHFGPSIDLEPGTDRFVPNRNDTAPEVTRRAAKQYRRKQCDLLLDVAQLAAHVDNVINAALSIRHLTPVVGANIEPIAKRVDCVSPLRFWSYRQSARRSNASKKLTSFDRVAGIQRAYVHRLRKCNWLFSRPNWFQI